MEWETCFLTKFSYSGLPFLEPHFFGAWSLVLFLFPLASLALLVPWSPSFISFSPLTCVYDMCKCGGVLQCRVHRPKYPSKSPLFLGSLTAIIYKHLDMQASWTPHGLDVWYLGPSKDHYHCHHYYTLKTRRYRIPGSANLFPLHCLEPLYSHYSHVQDLSLELHENLLSFGRKKTSHATTGCIYLRTPPLAPEQRAEDEEQRVLANIGQGICPAIQRVSNVPPTMLANNPTSKQVLQSKEHTHQCRTWRNTPGALPKITCPKIAPPLQANTQTPLITPLVTKNTPHAATTLTVSQLQARKTKTVATDMAPRRST
jgi:hypothetical protein